MPKRRRGADTSQTSQLSRQDGEEHASTAFLASIVMPSNDEEQSGGDGPSESESPIQESNPFNRRALASVVSQPVGNEESQSQKRIGLQHLSITEVEMR